MSQHDMVLDNQAGAAFRADLNNALLALVGQSSGATEPATKYAYQWWADTTTGLLKIRNAGNNAWITIGTLASAGFGIAPAAASQAQQEAGSSNSVMTTPGVQQHHPSANKVWGVADETGTLFVNYNVTSVTDVGTGIITVTIATDYSGAVYPIVPSVYDGSDAVFPQIAALPGAGSFSISCHLHDGTLNDPQLYYWLSAGDQA